MTKPLILLAACCLSVSAWAADTDGACDQAGNDFETLTCLNRAYEAAEQTLNASYKELIGLLDADGRARLRSHQLAWLKTRNAQCSQRQGTRTSVDPRCTTKVTAARAQWLQARIGECKNGGCVNENL